jgi:hypothetical protein
MLIIIYKHSSRYQSVFLKTNIFWIKIILGCARTQTPRLGFLQRWATFCPMLSRVGFVANKVTLERIFSEYLGSPCQFSFHRLLHIH